MNGEELKAKWATCDKGCMMIVFHSARGTGTPALAYLPKQYSFAEPGELYIPSRRGFLYSLDGDRFYECVVNGGSSRTHLKNHSHSFSFSIPQLSDQYGGLNFGADVTYSTDDDIVRVNDMQFNRTPRTVADSAIVRLPLTRRTVYDFVGAHGLEVYVDDWKYSDDHDSYVLKYCGSIAKIGDITTYRDGGTTIIQTDSGTFYVPSPFKRTSQDATWTDLDGTVHVLKERK